MGGPVRYEVRYTQHGIAGHGCLTEQSAPGLPRTLKALVPFLVKRSRSKTPGIVIATYHILRKSDGQCVSCIHHGRVVR